MPLKGLIPAAGAGVRAYPATTYTPKVMLEIAGKPLLLRNIELLRDKLGVIDITIVIGYKADSIRSFLGDGSAYGVNIRYIECADHTVGLAQGVYLAKDRFDEPFVTILGDEMYIDTNHEILADFADKDFSAVCGLMRTDDFSAISKNYSVKIKDGKIIKLVEKPEDVQEGILGCGTYLFSPRIFSAIEKAPPSPRSGKVELTDAINLLSKDNKVYPAFLEGAYSNINSVEDYNFARYIYHSANFDKYKVSVIIPAYNEEESIAAVVRDFKGHVDEVLVVNNSSADNTEGVAKKAGARVETVSKTGYGDTIRYGLDHAVGDIMVIVEADNSFRAKDLGKFLEYLKDSDMVIGTRTTRQMIEQGANMEGPLRWGNVVVGKLVEALWWGQEPRFTDVGCTYRAIWKDAYLSIRDNLTSVGPEFSPEMMIEALRARKRVIEIPISYYPRLTGESKHSKSYYHISKTALKMLKLIFRKRFFG